MRGAISVPDKAAFGLQLVIGSQAVSVSFAGMLGLGFATHTSRRSHDTGAAKRRRPCRGLFQAGQLGLYMGRYDEAAAHLHDGVAIAESLGDRAAVQAVFLRLLRRRFARAI